MMNNITKDKLENENPHFGNTLLGAVLLTKYERMKKWEYYWDTVENYNGIIVHQEFLQKRSSEGWELVSTIMVEVGSEKRLRFYWKRELL